MADGPAISFLQLAGVARGRLGPLAKRVPTEEAPGPEPAPLIIHNDRAKQELGWRSRPANTTIVETAESLRDLGLLEEHWRPAVTREHARHLSPVIGLDPGEPSNLCA